MYDVFAKASYAQKLLKGRIIDYYTNQAYQDTLTQVFLLTSDSTTVDSGYVGPEGNIKQGRQRLSIIFKLNGKVITSLSAPIPIVRRHTIH